MFLSVFTRGSLGGALRGVAELMQPFRAFQGCRMTERVTQGSDGTAEVATWAGISNPLGCYGLEIRAAYARLWLRVHRRW